MSERKRSLFTLFVVYRYSNVVQRCSPLFVQTCLVVGHHSNDESSTEYHYTEPSHSSRPPRFSNRESSVLFETIQHLNSRLSNRTLDSVRDSRTERPPCQILVSPTSVSLRVDGTGSRHRHYTFTHIHTSRHHTMPLL